MHEVGIPEAEGITFTQQTKQVMVQLMKQRMAEGHLKMPYDRGLLDEFNVEKYELTKPAGSPSTTPREPTTTSSGP